MPLGDASFSPTRRRRLAAVVSALVEAKRDDDFRDTAHWLAYFDTAERSHSWWPTAAEADDFARRWEAAPVALRLTDPSFRPPAWDFESMIDAFQNGDYELLGCRRVAPTLGRLEFDPHGWPCGGIGCMKVLIEAFGHRIVADALA